MIESFPTREALYDAAAERLTNALTAAVATRGAAAFAASGGTTPAPVFERMAGLAAPWDDITVTLTDERWTPPTSPASNEGLLRRTLLTDRAASARFTPLWSDVDSAQTAALAADASLRSLTPFGAVMLGMGPDGHFASLFPGSSALAEGLDPAGPRLCIAVPPAAPAPDIWRISLTLAALAETPLIVVLITGEEKRELIQKPAGHMPIRALLDQFGAQVRVLWAA